MKLENMEKARQLLIDRSQILRQLSALELNEKEQFEDFRFGHEHLTKSDGVNSELETAHKMIKHALEKKIEEVEKAIGEVT